jgi:transmembrane 9 superfamily member 3
MHTPTHPLACLRAYPPQWISFLASGSTALYVFLYSIYYFWFKTKMSGLLQVSFYFGYM